MRKVLLIGSALMLATLASAATSGKQPTEAQRTKLENAQLKLQLIQKDADTVAARWNAQTAAFNAVCDEVKKENGWPKDAICNVQTLQIEEPPPKPDPKAEPPKK